MTQDSSLKDKHAELWEEVRTEREEYMGEGTTIEDLERDIKIMEGWRQLNTETQNKVLIWTASVRSLIDVTERVGKELRYEMIELQRMLTKED